MNNSSVSAEKKMSFLQSWWRADEALVPRILLSLACHPSRTARWDYRSSIVKALIVDKRPTCSPSMHHLQAISILSEGNKHYDAAHHRMSLLFFPSQLTPHPDWSPLYLMSLSEFRGWAWLEGRIPTQVPGMQSVFNISLFICNYEMWSQNFPFICHKYKFELI